MEKWVDFSFAVVLGEYDHVFREALEIVIIKRYDFYRRSTTELQTSKFPQSCFLSEKAVTTTALFLKTI